MKSMTTTSMLRSSTGQITLAIALYSMCSSTLLLANKMAMDYLPQPCFVTLIQLVFSVVVLYTMKCCGVDIDDIEWAKAKPYLIYITSFSASLFTNRMSLKYSNVETIIVFRACTPISVTIIEYMLMGRALPSTRSAVSLIFTALFAVVYCLSDSEFDMKGLMAYAWVIVYFLFITFEMTYGKNLTSNVKMKSIWGSVLYCNLFAIVPTLFLGWVNQEFDRKIVSDVVDMSLQGWLLIGFSCVTGLCIGYTGWYCRSLVSAATYTLVGVVNKFLTILLNVVVWDKHSSMTGNVAVCLCLLSGLLYEQAPMRRVVLNEAAVLSSPDLEPSILVNDVRKRHSINNNNNTGNTSAGTSSVTSGSLAV